MALIPIDTFKKEKRRQTARHGKARHGHRNRQDRHRHGQGIDIGKVSASADIGIGIDTRKQWTFFGKGVDGTDLSYWRRRTRLPESGK